MASADRRAGFERTGARSAVVLEVSDSGRMTAGSWSDGGVYGIVRLETSGWSGWVPEWDWVEGVGGSGRGVSPACLDKGGGVRSYVSCVNGDGGIWGVPVPLALWLVGFGGGGGGVSVTKREPGFCSCGKERALDAV